MSWQRPYSELRASDAERERVVAFMREHALAGRLTDEELEDRIGLAYSAVSVGDLERLIADLPRAQRPAQRPSAPPRPRRDPTPALIVAGAAMVLLVGLPLLVSGVIAVVAIVFALSFALGPFLLVALLVVLASRRRRTPPPMRWGPQH